MDHHQLLPEWLRLGLVRGGPRRARRDADELHPRGEPAGDGLLEDIAYQAKCVIYLKEDTFHLLHLPATPTPVDTITEDDVMVDSLQVTCTATEDLVTKYTRPTGPTTRRSSTSR
jgi:hypothetical protein